MRTSFHHQPEAQHPKSPAIYTPAGRLPHLCANSRHWACNAKQQKKTQIYGGLHHTAPWAFADSALSALDQWKPPLAYFMTSPGNQSDSAGTVSYTHLRAHET